MLLPDLSLLDGKVRRRTGFSVVGDFLLCFFWLGGVGPAVGF
jgi:hypothetical protein